MQADDPTVAYPPVAIINSFTYSSMYLISSIGELPCSSKGKL